MIGYICKRCPLAFEVGYTVYWDLSGGCRKLICRHCGTMHKIEHLDQKPDLLFALAGPIRSMVDERFDLHDGDTIYHPRLPDDAESWRTVGPLPTAIEYLHGPFVLPDRARMGALDQVTCAHCGCAGVLVPDEWSSGLGRGSNSFGEDCPVCKGALESVYVSTA